MWNKHLIPSSDFEHSQTYEGWFHLKGILLLPLFWVNLEQADSTAGI